MDFILSICLIYSFILQMLFLLFFKKISKMDGYKDIFYIFSSLHGVCLLNWRESIVKFVNLYKSIPFTCIELLAPPPFL